MAITTEKYIPDRGQVEVNGTTYEGSVRTVSPSSPRRTERIINSLGGSVTEVNDHEKAGDFEVALNIFDDKSLSHDTATSLMHLLHNAYETNTKLTSFKIVPAGSTPGMSEYTYGGDIHVVQCPPHGGIDADTDDDAVADVVITAQTVAVAALV